MWGRDCEHLDCLVRGDFWQRICCFVLGEQMQLSEYVKGGEDEEAFKEAALCREKEPPQHLATREV